MAKGEIQIHTNLYAIAPHVSTRTSRTGFLSWTIVYRLAGYPQIGQAACGKAGIVIVQVFHKATLVGYVYYLSLFSQMSLQQVVFESLCFQSLASMPQWAVFAPRTHGSFASFGPVWRHYSSSWPGNSCSSRSVETAMVCFSRYAKLACSSEKSPRNIPHQTSLLTMARQWTRPASLSCGLESLASSCGSRCANMNGIHEACALADIGRMRQIRLCRHVWNTDSMMRCLVVHQNRNTDWLTDWLTDWFYSRSLSASIHATHSLISQPPSLGGGIQNA